MVRLLPLFAALVLPSIALAAAPPPSGPAGPAITAYMRGTKIPCYTQSGEGRCSIASLAEDTSVFYGKPDPLAEIAVVFVTYQYDATGNAMDQMAIVLRKEGDKWLPVGRANRTVGTEPRDVRFSPGAITYTGTIAREGDSRADPTGKATFHLVIGAKGIVFGEGEPPPAPNR